ncbi:MAG: hypothetical protein ABIF08_03920 [Nanoarchaeota archaeon]
MRCVYIPLKDSEPIEVPEFRSPDDYASRLENSFNSIEAYDILSENKNIPVRRNEVSTEKKYQI